MPKCKDKLEVSPARLAYWDAKLKQLGLSVDAGRREWITYGFTLTELDFDGRRVIKVDGERLAEKEWPISLC